MYPCYNKNEFKKSYIISSQTYFVTGSSPFTGGEFGKYTTRGYSEELVGSHPKNVARSFTPVEMN